MRQNMNQVNSYMFIFHVIWYKFIICINKIDCIDSQLGNQSAKCLSQLSHFRRITKY